MRIEVAKKEFKEWIVDGRFLPLSIFIIILSMPIVQMSISPSCIDCGICNALI